MSTHAPLFAARIALVAPLLGAGCTWEPVARPIQPQRVLESPARVERLLAEGRYVLVRTGAPVPSEPTDAGAGDAQPPAISELVEPVRWRMVNIRTFTSCEFPDGHEPRSDFERLVAPALKRADKPEFLLPVLHHREGEPPQLYLSDQECRLEGPYGPLLDGPGRLTLRADGRQVLILRDPEFRLNLVDPWDRTQRTIATEVDYWTSELPQNQNEPEALWLIEAGRLTRRTLDGNLLLSLGSHVKAFAVKDYAPNEATRVAYVDGVEPGEVGDLIEAKAPEYVPVLIARDACGPGYASGALNLHTPCEPAQLVRIVLRTGEIQTFRPGVVASFQQGNLTFEQVRGADGAGELWVTTRSGVRVQLTPIPSSYSMLDDSRLVGRASDGQFGVWSFQSGFQRVFGGVRRLWTFVSSRTNALTWLMLHDIDRARNLGTLSRFEQREVERFLRDDADPANPANATLVAQEVPTIGASVQILDLGGQSEPAVMTFERASVEQGDDPTRFLGTLYVRLLSGELGAQIAEGASSAWPTMTPVPGILYGITEGPNSGLWFAAL